MPLRVTIELIPHGDESSKRRLAVVDITNDGTGTPALGNYYVQASGHDLRSVLRVSFVPRGDYMRTVARCIRNLSLRSCNDPDRSAAAVVAGEDNGRGYSCEAALIAGAIDRITKNVSGVAAQHGDVKCRPTESPLNQ